ncbi:hypothetical protein SUNI508_06162 [Seiridium unicorne]|uniref:Uncharacterized protein n=1 Tax=Seiridium unicorne TaxID=138068 RepID=A0ABR2V2D8_9PEZI
MVTAADLSENMLLELSDDGQARLEGQLEGALSGFWTAHATRRQIGGAEWCFLAKPYYMATPLPAAGPMRSDLLEDDFSMSADVYATVICWPIPSPGLCLTVMFPLS